MCIRDRYHTDHKKQHQERKTNRLHSAVDIDNDRPDPAALEILRCSRNELPYLSEFFIPSFEGVLEILNYPVITQFRRLGSSEMWKTVFFSIPRRSSSFVNWGRKAERKPR